MPKFQSNVLLQGFQLIDFCIENAVSLEGLSDINTGRKVFLTGNDTNIGYLRENVWDGGKWRAAAYLDDLDKITNGEGSLGTRVKVLEDMLNVDSAETVVSTWEEIQAFFDNVKEGTDLMTMLDGKLDTKGGTIYKDGNPVPLTIKSTGEYAGLGLKIGENGRAVLAYYGGLDWRVTNESYQSEAKILHNLNFESLIGDTYLKTTGGAMKGTGSYVQEVLSIDTDNEFYTIFSVKNQGNLKGRLEWTPDTSSGASVAGFGLYNATTRERLHLSDNGGVFLGINPLIHSGNVGEYTAGAANRLANKVSLWGNEFDGTQSLNGSISFKDGDKLRSVLDYTSNSEFHLGYGTRTLNLTIWGTPIYIYTNSTRAMTITDGGRVVVGTDASVDGDKLYSRGRVNILSLCDNPTLGNMPENGLVMTDNRSTLGIAQWVSNGTGSGNIQACRFDGTATANALNLNPLGGAVNVGDGGLYVAEKVVISRYAINTKVAYTGTANGANYIWGYDTNNYLCIGAQGTTLTRAASSMVVESNAVYPGTNNAVSLGASSYRWSNVYSVEGNFSGNVRIANDYGLLSTTTSGSVVQMVGITKNNAFYVGTDACIVNKMPTNVYGSLINFYTGATLETRTKTMTLTSSGHVLIGEAVDDADYALNVKGDSYFGGTVYIPSGQKLTIGSVTFEEDAAGRVKVDGDMYTTGTLASGGKAKEGTGTGSGSANVRDFELPADEKTTYYCDHLLKTKNVIVQVFEKAIQNNIEVWDMIVADVTIVTEDRVTVTFGRPTTKVHKVHIIGGNVS